MDASVDELSIDGVDSYVSLKTLCSYKEGFDNDKVKKVKKVRLNEIFFLNASLKYSVGVIRKFLFAELYVWNGGLVSYLK